MLSEQISKLEKYDKVGNYSDISKYVFGNYVLYEDVKTLVQKCDLIQPVLSVWVYDDLFEDGYRFDDIVNARYCIIPTMFAKSMALAVDFLAAAYAYIPKIKGASKPMEEHGMEQIIGNKAVLVIRE